MARAGLAAKRRDTLSMSPSTTMRAKSRKSRKTEVTVRVGFVDAYLKMDFAIVACTPFV